MARRSKKYEPLPGSTPVDVVAVKDERVIIKEMTLLESRNLKRTRGWEILVYKKGFHAFRATE